jgi:membrane-associated protein
VIEHAVNSIGVWAYPLVLVLTAAETGAFVGVVLPGETLVIFAGALAGQGKLDVVALSAAVVIGSVLGDNIGFAVGRWCRQRPGAQRVLGRLQPGGRSEKARALLNRRGGAAVFLARFVGVVRSFVPMAAGLTELPYRRFVPYTAAAGLVWGIGSVLIGYLFGPDAEKLVRTVGTTGAVAAGGAVAVMVLFLLARRRRAGVRRLSAATSDSRPPEIGEPAARTATVPARSPDSEP